MVEQPTNETSPPGVVLIVDDEQDNLDVFRLNFEDDFEVHTAASGEEALRLLGALETVELVVADLRMPGMNGLDLLEACRSGWPHVGRILLTGHTNEDLLVESINRQVLHRFISKPWEYEQMLEILRDGVARHRLSVRNATLERQVGQASHLAMLGELSAALMHDIAQPLQVIESGIGVADEIVHGDERTITDEITDLREAIADAGAAVRHLCDLTTTIKGLMRKREASLAPTTLDAVIRESMVMIDRMARGRRVEVTTEVPEGLPPLHVDRVQIAQLLLNLASNACDAMAGLPERKLFIGVVPAIDGDQVLVVNDTGPGMPRSVQARVFEPFFSTKDEGKGTGLGLSIVKRIAQDHHAELDLTSTPGSGTAFRVRFPGRARALSRPEIRAVESRTPTPAPALRATGARD